jgi:hypothetical protein
MEDIRKKSIFLDIDGTIIKHCGNLCSQYLNEADVLPNVKEKLLEWDLKGYNIILTTGRRESCRSHTEKQLANAGIFYDQLIMGIGGGQRILINDSKPNSTEPTAIAFTVERNVGIGDLEI